MADYYCQVQGTFSTDLAWSFGAHVTSNQAEATLATTWNNAWVNAWTNATYGLQTLYPTSTEFTGTSVATLNATMHEVSKTRLADAAPGTAAGDTLPYINAVVISMRSTSIQKHGRGRMYLPALEETHVNGDIVIPAATAQIKTAVEAVFSAVTADGSTFFVTNKKPLKDGTPAYGKTVITSWLVSNKPARQSRRVKKVPALYI